MAYCSVKRKHCLSEMLGTERANVLHPSSYAALTKIGHLSYRTKYWHPFIVAHCFKHIGLVWRVLPVVQIEFELYPSS